MSRPKVFIDGEAGTTGLQIRDRLAGREDFELLAIGPERRKDIARRQELLNEADIAILCLPDAAAQESVLLVDNDRTRIIDASSRYRVEEGWVYGLAEMAPKQAEKIASASRVTNPGCWPQGFIALTRPLVEAGLVPNHHPASVYGVSGYSGGGRSMIERYEAAGNRFPEFQPYALEFVHKHLPEMRQYSGLTAAPLFAPAVGRFKQGMIVSVPLHMNTWERAPTVHQVHAALADHYSIIRDSLVGVAPLGTKDGLDPQIHNGEDRLTLFVFGNDDTKQVLLTAVYDNLGKGASGAAVQNLDLMLGGR